LATSRSPTKFDRRTRQGLTDQGLLGMPEARAWAVPPQMPVAPSDQAEREVGPDMANCSNVSEAARRIEFVHEVWPAQPRYLARIRSKIRRWLAPLPLTEQAQHDLIVAVDEAASNAIKHAYPEGAENKTVEVTFWTEPTTVNIEVVDHGRWRTPSARPHRWSRGIALMQRLIESVMIRFDDRGTRVFLRHTMPGTARVPPPGDQQPVALELPADGGLTPASATILR
jgi:anti-sigma regulatory factor (Ser/Thr protein kinase)